MTQPIRASMPDPARLNLLHTMEVLCAALPRFADRVHICVCTDKRAEWQCQACQLVDLLAQSDSLRCTVRVCTTVAAIGHAIGSNAISSDSHSHGAVCAVCAGCCLTRPRPPWIFPQVLVTNVHLPCSRCKLGAAGCISLRYARLASAKPAVTGVHLALYTASEAGPCLGDWLAP